MNFLLFFSFLFLLQPFNGCICANFPPKSYAFLFPSQPHNASAILSNVPFSKDTKEFTLSVWIYQLTKTNLNWYFSFAVPGIDNTIVFGPTGNNKWLLYIINSSINFGGFVRVNQWVHYALTWRSEDGSVMFYVNGKLVHSGFYLDLKGKTWVDKEGTLAMGQDQDIIGGGFEAAVSFRGEMTEVNIWDSVLNAAQVQKVYHSQLEGNIVSWSRSVWRLLNISVVEPTVHGLCKDNPTTEINESDVDEKESILSPKEIPLEP